MEPRAVVAILLLAILGGGLWWVAGQAPGPEGGSGAFAVAVVGPEGLWANGTVDLQDASALSALEALARLLGFDVGVEEAAAFSGCSQAYVRSIGPYAESVTGGWNYYLREPGGAWEWQSAGAACGIPAGVDVEWCWVEHDVCTHHVS